MLGNILTFLLSESTLLLPFLPNHLVFYIPNITGLRVEGGLQTRSPMCTTYFKQHLHDLSVCDVSSTCTCTVCLRQQPFLKGMTFYIVLNCVYNLDQFQLLCNTINHQYVYAVYSGSLSIEQIVPADFPNITADYRFHYYLPKQKFHTDCLPPDGQAIRARYGSKKKKFRMVDDAIASLTNHEHKK